jgi:hypothetical protein
VARQFLSLVADTDQQAVANAVPNPIFSRVGKRVISISTKFSRAKGTAAGPGHLRLPFELVPVRVGGEKSIIDSILGVGSVPQQPVCLSVQNRKAAGEDLLQRLSCPFSAWIFEIFVSSDGRISVLHALVLSSSRPRRSNLCALTRFAFSRLWLSSSPVPTTRRLCQNSSRSSGIRASVLRRCTYSRNALSCACVCCSPVLTRT